MSIVFVVRINGLCLGLVASPFNPVIWRQRLRQVNFCEFQASQGYVVKPYLKKEERNTKWMCLTVCLASFLFDVCVLYHLLEVAMLYIVPTTHLFPQVPARLGR